MNNNAIYEGAAVPAVVRSVGDDTGVTTGVTASEPTTSLTCPSMVKTEYAAVPLTTSVASIVAPLPYDRDLKDDMATHSPAVSALLLASSAPSVSPVVSATGAAHMALSMAAAASASASSTDLGTDNVVTSAAKIKVERVKPQMGMNGGRWTEQEHQSFLAGLRLYGREWKKVASKIKTRTSAQIRSHAQKYFAKLARDDEMRKHSGLLPLQDGGAAATASAIAAQRAAGLYTGYYSDDGSSTAMNSGDDSGDTDSSTGPRSRSSSNATLAGLDDPASTYSVSQSASNLAALFAGTTAAPTSLDVSAQQTKKRARVVSALGTAMSLQPLPTAKVAATNANKQHKVTSVRDVSTVGRLPSQEELLAKVSPTIRQRLSSLIEAELCALQVLSCSALLQRQGSSSAVRETQATAPATSSSSATFAVQPAMGLSMIATEQIPSMSSIY